MKHSPQPHNLIKSIQDTPPRCTHLKLDRLSQEGGNAISLQTITESFKYIPARVQHLDLSYNELFFKNQTELHHLIKAIPQSITHLDLRGNGLPPFFQKKGGKPFPLKSR